MVLTAGTFVDGRYRVAEMLGRGGMADVFRAVDQRTEQSVALKVLRGADPTSTERFRAEVEALRRLDHPGVVGLQGSGVHDGAAYLVLDLVDGPPLDRELEDGPLGVDRSVTIGRDVAAALAEAHRLAIVHRDVKPSNVLLDGEGYARLSDFGIARMLGAARLTATGALVGSPAYVAPEQLGSEPAGPAADVYALGLVVVECLTGTPCYSGSPSEAALARLQRRPTIPDDVPHWLDEVLAAMTTRHADRRPTAGAVADAFEHRRADAVVPITAPIVVLPAAPPDRPRATWPGRVEAACAAAAAVLLLAGLAVGSVVDRSDPSIASPPTTTTTAPATAPPATTTTTTAAVPAIELAAAHPAPGPARPEPAKAKGKPKHKDKHRDDDD